MRKEIIGICIALLLLVYAYIGEPLWGMEPLAYRTLFYIFAMLTLWIAEPIPIAVTGFLLIILQPMMGIQTLAQACEAFFNPALLFAIASYGTAITLLQTNVSKRILLRLLSNARTNPAKVVHAFGFSTALVSTICSDVPTTILFVGLAGRFLDEAGLKPRESRLGLALMLVIPFASLIGGTATPAGSAANVLGVQLLATQTGIIVPFLTWMAVGIPIVLILVPLSNFIIIKITKPEPLTRNAVELIDSSDITEKLSKDEKKTIVIILCMLIAWISTTWLQIGRAHV